MAVISSYHVLFLNSWFRLHNSDCTRF